MIDIDALVGPIPTVDHDVVARATARQDQLTKPPGSLGALERLGVRLAGILGDERPHPTGRVAAVFAGDHGVVARGVSAYPAAVTAQMVHGFLAGTAVVSALARAHDVEFRCVDVGVATDLPDHPSLVAGKVAHGTADMTTEPAMTDEQCVAALRVGVSVADELVRPGVLVGTGEMGIGNTTPAAALTAVLTGHTVDEVTGRGTGVDDDGLARKRDAVTTALRTHGSSADDPLGALRDVGGLEIAALTGFVLRAAALGGVVVLDGYITAAAALVAVAVEPAVVDRLVASHVGAEAGHRLQLTHLGLEPVLDLGLRLGEASGALLAMPIIDAAAAVLREVATFAEAGVDGPADP